MNTDHIDIDGHADLNSSAQERGARKIALTLLALGAASSVVVFGSLAAWTAQTTNPGNSVTTGTLSLTTDKPAAAVFTATDVVPGDTGGDTVTVENTSSVPLDLTLTQNAVVQGAGAALQIQIFDGTNCVYPAGAGACAGYAAWDGAATLNALAQGTLAPAATKTYTVNWQLGAGSVNSDQGQANTFTLQWDGTPA